MYLLLLGVQSREGETEQGLSVWSHAPDEASAETAARIALEQAGWELVTVTAVVETSDEDYFRPCASQQAYRRAQAEGIAWRFDGTDEVGP